MPRLDPYHKTLGYSYALGVFPCLELLAARPACARRLLLSEEGLRNEGVAQLRERCFEMGVREEFATRVLAREARKQNCYAALVFDKYEDELSERDNHVALHHVSDGGNLGTALRSLLGFGLRDVAIVRPAVDFFDPHVLRASMGAAFHVRPRYYDDFEEYRARYPAHALYPFMLTGSRALDEVAARARAPYTLVFGNEQTGLPARFAELGQSTRIPHEPCIDSLNLAVAVAIGAYAFYGNGRAETTDSSTRDMHQ